MNNQRLRTAQNYQISEIAPINPTDVQHNDQKPAQTVPLKSCAVQAAQFGRQDVRGEPGRRPRAGASRGRASRPPTPKSVRCRRRRRRECTGTPSRVRLRLLLQLLLGLQLLLLPSVGVGAGRARRKSALSPRPPLLRPFTSPAGANAHLNLRRLRC